MAEQFSILVLSDTHIGKPGTATDTADVFEPLYSDIESVAKDNGIGIGAVVFAGDLAFGAVPEAPLAQQYEVATVFLQRVCEAAGSSLGSLPVLIAPGNHDIDRSLIDSAQKSFVDGLRNEKDAGAKVHEMMTGNDLTWKRLLERQQEWWSFVKELPGNEWTCDDDLLLTYGILSTPLGEVGLCALNTAWASYKPNENGQLWIGKHQIQRACQAQSGCRLKIAVMHHPVGWLHGEDKSFADQRIESVFDVRVHGHEHAAWCRSMKGHLMIETGAAYQGSAKANGYCFLSITNGANGSRVYCREYSEDGGGGWRPRVIPGRASVQSGVYDVSDAFAPIFQITGCGAAAESGAETDTRESREMHRVDEIFGSTSHVDSVATVSDVISVLEKRFCFRWEHSTVDRVDGSPVVYWPVRLRPPSPIHAVQAFTAAALHKVGGHIVLCIDDLGKKDYNIESLVHAIELWMGYVGGNAGDLELRTFSDVVGARTCEEAWPLVQDWLGRTEYKLDRVLQISKLYAPGEGLDDVLSRRPRRLLSPAVVWACLEKLSSTWDGMPIITLGGYDESLLWHAWRICAESGALAVGHLYIPELKEATADDGERPIHMEKMPLDWTSKDDIRRSLSLEMERATGDGSLCERLPMLGWVVTLCRYLPRFVANPSAGVLLMGPLKEGLDDRSVLEAVVDGAGEWLFP